MMALGAATMLLAALAGGGAPPDGTIVFYSANPEQDPDAYPLVGH